MNAKPRLGYNSPFYGFTLVELLVVITIIGILIALLLPAVQAAREAARKMQCQNNLKQIDLALQTYASANSTFPPAAILRPPYPNFNEDYDPWYEAASADPGMQGTSWMLLILPFMDYSNLYDQWDFTKSVIGNKALATTDIGTFYCPSRRFNITPDHLQIMFQQWAHGGTDYGGCLGRQNAFINTCTNGVSHKLDEGQWLFETDKRGMFVPDRGTKPADIEDGIAKTIMVGELQRLIPPNYVPRGEDPTYYGPCMTSNDGWALGGLATLFDTAVRGEGTDVGQPGGFNNLFFESAGSEHPNGANFGLADGSVHFFSENIDSQLYAYLGSINDGQPVQVP
jgi:prepilin-type N-terminal cleavage/methylation domain-containing protein/prepilin-type processing-associated H-X9-DG protein